VPVRAGASPPGPVVERFDTLPGMADYAKLEVEDGIGTLRIDRPPMNALDVQLQEEIRAAAHEAGERDDVRSVIVYGGEKVFAAGADIVEMAEMSYPDMVRRSVFLQSSFTAVARIPKPVVAAVTGYALGGGCELALCADIRIAADNAKLGQPEILLGIIPGAGGTQRLSRLVGPAKAKDLIFTGRFVDAEEALRIGLVDKVVPAADVYADRHDGASSREGVDRPRARRRPRHRARDRAPAVRRPLRDRRSNHRLPVLHGERARQGDLCRSLTSSALVR
jgi:enoyl-CoA hydratase/carnithine racemase